MHIGTKTRPAGSQAGGTLLEVLVSILVLSFALIGMLVAQGSSVVYQRGAGHHLKATYLALQLGDLARANIGGFRADAYQWSEPYLSGRLPASPTCGGTACSPQSVASSELGDWLTRVRDQLPQGDAFVVRSTDGFSMDIWVMWRVSNAVATPSTTATCTADALAGVPPAERPYCIFFRVST